MKKLLLVAVIFGFGLFVCENSFAQESVKNRVGLFLAAASGDIDEIGLGGVGEFRVANKVAISPQLVFYFPEDRGGADFSVLEINVNANYYFFNQDMFEFYGLAGLNFARWSFNPDFGDSYSDTEIGLNLGAGMNFEVSDKVVPFAELRITVGDLDQFVFGVGLKFNMGR